MPLNIPKHRNTSRANNVGIKLFHMSRRTDSTFRREWKLETTILKAYGDRGYLYAEDVFFSM